jgi:carnitine O-acetyltransferase
MALQLAWQRMHKNPTAVYETASTRAFKHGRTETCRSLTTETWKFAQAFDNDNVLVCVLLFFFDE